MNQTEQLLGGYDMEWREKDSFNWFISLLSVGANRKFAPYLAAVFFDIMKNPFSNPSLANITQW